MSGEALLIGMTVAIGLIAFVLVARYEEPLSGAALRRRRWWRFTQIVLPLGLGYLAMVYEFEDGFTEFYDPRVMLGIGGGVLFVLIAANWVRVRIARLWHRRDETAERGSGQGRSAPSAIVGLKSARVALLQKYGRNGSHVLQPPALGKTLEGRAIRRISQDTSKLGGVPAEPKPLDKLTDNRESPRR
jgi:hypothetical protein